MQIKFENKTTKVLFKSMIIAIPITLAFVGLCYGVAWLLGYV